MQHTHHSRRYSSNQACNRLYKFSYSGKCTKKACEPGTSRTGNNKHFFRPRRTDLFIHKAPKTTTCTAASSNMATEPMTSMLRVLPLPVTVGAGGGAAVGPFATDGIVGVIVEGGRNPNVAEPAEPVAPEGAPEAFALTIETGRSIADTTAVSTKVVGAAVPSIATSSHSTNAPEIVHSAKATRLAVGRLYVSIRSLAPSTTVTSKRVRILGCITRTTGRTCERLGNGPYQLCGFQDVRST